MHLTRPKSSKGRSRPAVNNPLHAGDRNQGPPVSPDCPGYSRPDRHLRSQSQPTMWQTSQLSHEVLQMLQQTPAARPQSLNKYKVLPSIERRQPEAGPGGSLDRQTSRLSLSDDAVLQSASSSEVDKRADVPLRVSPDPGGAGSLLLAVRAPCGRRFQQHFDPTDTLLKVRSSAEVRFGARYGDASIETMDVPRRSFRDMEKTLAQCAILNRTVLCISQSDRAADELV